ncbi:hypothetical protein DL768_008250 [Monosporascus sp. mg162]|nr:hypothetical protein DL768_008250 [Monosporascus sp. mg162]
MMQQHIVMTLLGLAVNGAVADFEVYIRGMNVDDNPNESFTSHDHFPLTCEETRNVVTLDFARFNDASTRGWARYWCTKWPRKQWPRLQSWDITHYEMYNVKDAVLYKLDDDHNHYQMRDKYDAILGYCCRLEHPQEMARQFIDSSPSVRPS